MEGGKEGGKEEKYGGERKKMQRDMGKRWIEGQNA